jgi:hypothetical protein
MHEPTPDVGTSAGSDQGDLPGSAWSDRPTTVNYDRGAERRAESFKSVQITYIVVGLVEALLLVRLILRVLQVNVQTGFAHGVYGVTALLVAPFVGLFATAQPQGAGIEPHTLLALVVYAIVGWLLTRAAWVLFGDDRLAAP